MQPTRFGRYLLLEPLGAGGMGEVWLAQLSGDGGFSRQVVIKRIRATFLTGDDFLKMFEREARVLARLHHANVVQVYEYGRVDGEPFLALEYIDGVPLSRLLAPRTPVPPGLVAYVVRELGRALQAVHAAKDDDGKLLGLVHRDLTPSNVMLAVDGTVKLLDFGVAKTPDESLTASGSIRGKVSYAAPEVVEGQPHAASSDLFALGVLMHELLTGRRLFQADTDARTLQLVAAAEVPLPSLRVPEVPAALEAVCLKLLARLPGDRWASASELVAAIDPLVHELKTGPAQLAAAVAALPRKPRATSVASGAPEPVTVTRPEPTAAPGGRRRAGAAAGAAAVLGVLALTAWLAFGRAHPVVPAEPTAEQAHEQRPPAEPVPPAPAATAPEDEPKETAGARVLVFELTTVPPGAMVKGPNGKLLGVTPVTLRWPEDARPGVLQIERRGFRPVTLPLAAAGASAKVTLKPLKAGASSALDLEGGQVVDPFSPQVRESPARHRNVR